MNFLENISAYEYLSHHYEVHELPSLPLTDEDFVREWEYWLENPKEEPSDVKNVLSDEMTTSWIEKTPAGRIPVIYTRSRASFELATDLLYQAAFPAGIPASVNAFTIKAKHPALQGHRVIILNEACYSALAGSEVGIGEDEWLEKSMTLRLNHEICHYFSLRVLGGMRNHVLDEIAADCLGQLSAFGAYNASLQRRFFGISESDGNILPGNRFSFYVKSLRNDSIHEVLEETNAALSGLDSYLLKNPDMALASNGPRLIIKILSAGVGAMRDLR